MMSRTALILTLLAGCTPAPPGSGPVSGQSQIGSGQILPGTKGAILPGTKGAILPGSKGSILPGSKGERQTLASLDVTLKLPFSTGFAVQQLSGPEAQRWSAEVDGRKVRLAFKALRTVGEEQELSFSLSELQALTGYPFQELRFFSAEGVLQTAGLVPAFTVGQTRVAEVLGSESLASWMIASDLQAESGQMLQDVDPAWVKELAALPETVALVQTLAALYRQGKGKSDPLKHPEAMAQVKAAKAKLKQKMAAKGAGPAISPNPRAGQSGKPSPRPDPTPKPDKPPKPD